MESKVYWSSIEYKYGDASDNPEKLKGGFAYVFIKAFDVRDALEKISESLDRKGLHPIEIEFISPYDKETEWETSKETKHYKRLFVEALNSSDVVYDDLYAYEKF
ncbi:hypothetical protein H8S95_12555 [Pontibacter sp. KCTC 32443]|uniref:hypothetical protein n=1 Tax=Pontibacter TaxID=323449 RepID=UPI00164ED7E9|nr:MULTISPECIES: hypothetical protein [Pontibacter]MBC5774899.1 hypothetical protein [Pontibacter sp. KCTC 32443]